MGGLLKTCNGEDGSHCAIEILGLHSDGLVVMIVLEWKFIKAS